MPVSRAVARSALRLLLGACACCLLALPPLALLRSARSHSAPGAPGDPPSVAIVLAGAWRGTPFSAAELRRVVVAPLSAAGYDVHLYVAGDPDANQSAWRAWLEAAAGGTAAVSYVSGPSDTQLEATLDGSFFGCPGCAPCGQGNISACCVRNSPAVHAQYAKLGAAAALAAASGRRHAAVVKTRNDVVFNPAHAVQPCWLTHLPRGLLLANDRELHQARRAELCALCFPVAQPLARPCLSALRPPTLPAPLSALSAGAAARQAVGPSMARGTPAQRPGLTHPRPSPHHGTHPHSCEPPHSPRPPSPLRLPAPSPARPAPLAAHERPGRYGAPR